MNLGEIVNREDLLVGEIASVEGDILEVFVYPERFNDIHLGSLVLVDSDKLKILGLVVDKTHTSRYGTFSPLRKRREDIERTYPDLYRYHKYVSSVVYTSVLDGSVIKHLRRGSPKLHDMVYFLDKRDYVREFLSPRGKWDLRFIQFLAASKLSDLTVFEVLGNLVSKINLDESEIDDFLGELIERSWVVGRKFAVSLASYMEEVLGLR